MTKPFLGGTKKNTLKRSEIAEDIQTGKTRKNNNTTQRPDKVSTMALSYSNAIHGVKAPYRFHLSQAFSFSIA